MQLDQNRIAIRERGFLEILDLALRVIRAHAWPLLATFCIGAIPMILLNAWLLSDVVIRLDSEQYSQYVFYMYLLIVWQTPLAMAPLTLYLGQALFTDRPRAGQVVRSFFGSLPQLILYQVIVRALFVPLVVTWFLLYAWQPYLSEVILLERNPIARRGKQGMTTGRRTKALHRGYVAELFLRWLGALAIGALLVPALWCALSFLRFTLAEQEAWYDPWSGWEANSTLYTLGFALAAWLVVGYFTVVRFLGYLDLRIRREGWEIELMMRAEAARLMRQLT